MSQQKQDNSHLQSSSDSSEWAALYAEFSDEDRAMAEVCMAEYAKALALEDSATDTTDALVVF